VGTPLALVWGGAAILMFTVGTAETSHRGPTEAPAGFDGESNGFAEEFCA
jgi:hypothetical protein